jgi:hypothetical protein
VWRGPPVRTTLRSQVIRAELESALMPLGSLLYKSPFGEGPPRSHAMSERKEFSDDRQTPPQSMIVSPPRATTTHVSPGEDLSLCGFPVRVALRGKMKTKN